MLAAHIAPAACFQRRLPAQHLEGWLQVAKVKAQMKDPRFNVEGLLGISTAAAGLFKWVAAMVNYHAVAKTVEPKRKKVAEAEKALRAASKDLAQTQADIARLSAELEALNVSLAAKSAEQAELIAKADLMERRLAAASKLIEGLASERERWTRDMQTLDDKKVPLRAFVCPVLPQVAHVPDTCAELPAGIFLTASMRICLVQCTTCWALYSTLTLGFTLRNDCKKQVTCSSCMRCGC